MARKKQIEKTDKKDLPEPEMFLVDGKPVMTEGWVDGSRVIIGQQPTSDKQLKDVARVLVSLVTNQKQY